MSTSSSATGVNGLTVPNEFGDVIDGRDGQLDPRGLPRRQCVFSLDQLQGSFRDGQALQRGVFLVRVDDVSQSRGVWPSP
jgi:hypothetical protein